MSGKRAPTTSAVFVVDRREGAIVVVMDEKDNAIDVPASELPRGARAEGAVLRVPVDPVGAPRWGDAVRDRSEERRRRAELAARIDRLRRTDRGGDIDL